MDCSPSAEGGAPIEGWASLHPADGEHVAVLLHVASGQPQPSEVGEGHALERVEARTDSTVVLQAPYGPTDRDPTCRTYFFDQVMTERSDPMTAAALKCYARGVVSGTSTSIIAYGGWDASNPRPHALFNRTVTRCVGLVLAEHVVTECIAKKMPAYLGFGLYNHRDQSVVDLFGHASGHVTPLEPSCASGTLFPTMQEQHVATVQRVGDAVRMALKELTRLEDRALVPSHATIFMSVAVAVPVRLSAGNGTCIRMARLHVMDMTNFSHLKLLARVGTDPDVTPWLQRPMVSNTERPHPLPLIAFGVGMENRCVVMATVPSSVLCNPPHAETLHDASSSHSLTAVIGCLARLRSVCLAASAFGERVGGVPPVRAEELPMWRATLETMRLRRIANRIEADTRASVELRTKESTSELVRQAADNKQALSGALAHAWRAVIDVDTVPPNACGRSSWHVLRDRLELAREMQRDLLVTQRDLNEHRKYLMQLPVAAVGGMPVLSDRHRCALLERSVRLLEEENKRQRTLFARDVELLHLEVAPMVHAAASEANATPVMQRMLGPAWAALCEDVERLLRNGDRPALEGTVEGGRAATVVAAHRLIDDFADALKRDVSLLTSSMPSGNGGAGSTSAAVPGSEMVRHALDVSTQFCVGALESLATQLGLPMGAPTLGCDVPFDDPMGAPVDASGLQDSHTTDRALRYWRRIVVERLNAHTERSRVRHMAEALALHVHRSMEQLDMLLGELQKAPVGSTTTGGAQQNAGAMLGELPATVTVVGAAGRRVEGKRQSMREQVAEMLRMEMLHSAQSAVRQNLAATHEPGIRLTIERCRAIQAALMEAALGYAEAPCSEDESLTTSLMALLHHGADATAGRGRAAAGAPSLMEGINQPLASSVPWGEVAEQPADGDAAPTQQHVPTLHVALDDILRGKRIKAAAFAEAEGGIKPRVTSRLRQGFFSTGVVAAPSSSRSERGQRRL